MRPEPAGRVMVEQAPLEGLRAEEQALAKQAERSAAGAVGATLGNVSRKFYTIVRNADVGKIDVAWEQKETETQGSPKLGRAKEREMVRIREQFDEALGEQGRISDPLAACADDGWSRGGSGGRQGQDQPSEAPAAQAAADSEPSGREDR